jgi:hypothetical protein
MSIIHGVRYGAVVLIDRLGQGSRHLRVGIDRGGGLPFPQGLCHDRPLLDIDAPSDADGTSGEFDVRHEKPNGDMVGEFTGEITCLMVGGDVAVATGVISHGQVHLAPEDPITDVAAQHVSFTVLDNGRHDRMLWGWEFLGAPINDCQGVAPVFDPAWGGFKVSGEAM